MERPGVFAFLLGNRLAQLAFFGVSTCAVCVYTQVHDGRLSVPFLLGLSLGRYAGRARAHLLAFRSWKQEWKQMSGETGTDSAVARPRKRRRSWRGLVLTAAWVMLVFWLRNHSQEVGTTPHTMANLGLGVLTLWGAGAGLVRVISRLRRASQKATAVKPAEFIVRVVPAAPRSSPSLAQIRSALPAYCKRLMTAGSASPAAL